MSLDKTYVMESAADHSHHLLELLTVLLLFFGISGLAVPLLQRVRLSPVLAYLACGMIIGPYGFGLFVESIPWLKPLSIEKPETVQKFGELGIIALLFMIGLELSLRRLRELKHFVLGLGSLQIVLTAGVIAGIAALFENSTAAAVLIGASFALSSTAIVMQLLSEQHLINRPLGVLCFSILLMQDLAVVPILIMANAFSGSENQDVWMVLIESLAIAAFAVVAIYIVGKRLLRPLMNYVSFTKNPEWLTAFVLFMVVATATLTQMSGLSAALGAFLAGLLIAETEFRHEIEIIIEPLKSLLLGIFFLSIGMMIDVREVMSNPYWLLFSVIGIFAIKAAVIFPLARSFGVNINQATQASVMLAHPGEFAFMILSVAMAGGIMPIENGQFFLLITAVSMMLAPIGFKLAPWIAHIICKELAVEDDTKESGDTVGDHVIIAGFGRIGFMIGSILEKQMIPYVAIDRDPERVRVLKKQGYNVTFGDVKRVEQWRKMGAGSAAAVVIAIDEPEIAEDILRNTRKHWPHLPVMMRAKDTNAMKTLYDMGANMVVPEALESSLQLARTVMETVGVAEEELEEVINQSRKHAIVPAE